MNLALDESQIMLRDTLRRLASEGLKQTLPLAFDADSWDGDCQQLRDLGIFQLTTPAEQGGAGLGDLEACIAIEEIARHSPDLALVLTLRLAASVPAADNEGDLTPMPLQLASGALLAATSQAQGPTLRYHRFHGGRWATERTDDASWSTPELGFSHIRIADLAPRSEDGLGVQHRPRLALYLGALALGLAHRALQEGLEYSGDRQQFGQPINQFQAIRFKLSEMAARVSADRWSLWLHAAETAETTSPIPSLQPAELLDRLLRTATRVTDEALQIHGGYGYTLEYPVSHLFAASRQLQQWTRPQGLLS